MHRTWALFVVAGLLAVPVVSSAQTTTSYTYDDLGRVKTVSYPSGAKSGYNYDKVDNRTSTQTALNGVLNNPPTCSSWGFDVNAAPGPYSGQVTAAQILTHCTDPDNDPLTVTSPGTPYNYTISSGQTQPVSFTVSDGKGGTASAVMVIHRP